MIKVLKFCRFAFKIDLRKKMHTFKIQIILLKIEVFCKKLVLQKIKCLFLRKTIECLVRNLNYSKKGIHLKK